MFAGSMVALVTPFSDGEVDYNKLAELVEYQIDNGTNGIVPCGTTGESPTLNHEEHERVISKVIEYAKGKIPIIAGTGSNSTAETLKLTKHAKEAGADGALIITPYYNKPTQDGLYLHFKAITDAVDIPVVIYNVPSRTGVSITPETVAKLSEIRTIVGIKEASGNIDQASEILSLCDIDVLSGDDSLTLPLMAVGGKGVISVAANIVPRDVSDMVASFKNGNVDDAKQLHYKLFNLARAMFIETNPIPVKTAMKLLGRLNGDRRLPLCNMTKAHDDQLAHELKQYGLM
ncbi:MAG: 4-hydroxy-tetrahydrodipicolinate synthase [Candidatus Anammoxibacter sp.]